MAEPSGSNTPESEHVHWEAENEQGSEDDGVAGANQNGDPDSKKKRSRRKSISELGARIRKGSLNLLGKDVDSLNRSSIGDNSQDVPSSPLSKPGNTFTVGNSNGGDVPGRSMEELSVSDGELLDPERRGSIKGGKKSVAQTFKQMLIPQVDDEKVRALFQHLPENESLIDDFSCALQRDILVHGRLYVTQSYFSFHSNIFGWETVLSIPARDIVSIKKEKTALVFPNAVMVATATAKYTFASFITRDRAFTCMYHVWQNALLEHPLTPAELRTEAGKDWRNLNAKVSSSTENISSMFVTGPSSPSASEGQSQPPRRSYSPSGRSSSSLLLINGDSNDAGSETASGRLPTFLDSPAAAPSPSGNNNHSATSGAASPASPPTIAAPTTSEATQTAASSENLRVECGCEDHYGRDFIDAIYPCGPEFLFRTMFSYSQYFTEIYDIRKTSEVTMSEWKHLPDGTQDRELSYVLSLNYSFGPKSTRAYEKQVLLNSWEPNVKYIIEAEVGTPHVPYGDNFYTTSRYCITRHSETETRLQVRSLLRYRKGQPWAITKTLIEKNSYDGLAKYWRLLEEHMHGYIKRVEPKELYMKADAKASSSSSSSSKAASAPSVSTPPSHPSLQPAESSTSGNGSEGIVPGSLGPSFPLRRTHSRQHSITSMASIHAARMQEEKQATTAAAVPSGASSSAPVTSSSTVTSFSLTKIQMWVIIALIAILLITNIIMVLRLVSLEDKIVELLAK